MVIMAPLLKISFSFFILFSNLLYCDILDKYYDAQKKEMVETIIKEVRLTSKYLGEDKLDDRVIKALRSVQRHNFVPFLNRHSAYDNRPLPIGHGQTISQPYIVAIMTNLLKLKNSDKVLEIGTGSGYQAAILSKIVKKVYTIEIIKPLGLKAKERLRELGYDNIDIRIGDGYHGIKEKAPFDAIIVTAAAGHIPPPLIEQLKPGGRMIIPVGSRFHVQQLVLIKKNDQGELKLRQIMPVAFVPLTGKH